MNYLHQELTAEVIKAFYNVYNNLGFGFLEKVYERSMVLELKSLGLIVDSQRPIKVFYENVNVGEYFAHLVVQDSIIVELKAEVNIHPAHEAQLLNYLKATEIEVGLLFNFGEKPSFKRKIFTNKNLRKSAASASSVSY